ncbi:MAG: hypothetical protein F4156_03630, partial [Holophagales bacterium]|nr:hypothetical protein [Holophagales bacterium]
MHIRTAPAGPPVVVSVAFVGTPASGQSNTYKLGDTVTARVTFDSAVDVVGSPVLKLLFATGTEKDMTFDTSKARTNTMTLDFTYTVTATDTSAGLGFAANKLSAGAGVTIRETGTTTNATLTHSAVAADTNRKVDGSVPTFSSATVDGTTLKVTFSESLASGGTKPASSVFTVTATSGGTSTGILGSATAVTISGSTVTATLASAVAADATATVTYAKPSANPLADAANNQVAAFTGKSVANLQGGAPSFDDGDDVTLGIAENNADAASVGTVAATDPDGDTLTYSLASGGDNASFTIVSTTGEIKVASGTTLNHESKSRYSITAQVTDGKDAAGNTETTKTIDDTIDVTVNVTNVEEPPGVPTGLTVDSTTASSTKLKVSWTAPSNTGGRAIFDYDVRYFAGSADPADAADWIEEGETNGHTHTGTGTSSVVTNLTPGTAYRFQVRAEGDGEGAWSASVSGSTRTLRITRVRFGNAAKGGQNDTYKLGDSIQVLVDLSEAVTVTGIPVLKLQLASGVQRDMAFDSLTQSNQTLSFTYTVAAGDTSAGISIPANSLSVATGVTIRVPGTSHDFPLTHGELARSTSPERKVDGVVPTFSAAAVNGTALTVTFSEPIASGGSKPPSSVFTATVTAGGMDTTVNGTSAAVTVDGAQVTATLTSAVALGSTATLAYVKPSANAFADAAGNQAAAFSGKTLSAVQHTAPGFDDGDDVTLTIAENNADEASVGTVAATDADGDTLTYSLASGGDSASFTIVSGTGEIKVASGTTLNHESKAEYSITARVTDGEDASGNTETTATIDDTITVTVSVTNVEEPPGKPAAPSVTSTALTTVALSWTAPSSTGAKAITDYDLRYFAGSTDPTDAADWIEEGETKGHTHTGTARTATIANLTPARAYRFQVRAEGDGEGAWSDSVGATTATPGVSSIVLGETPTGQNDTYKLGDVVGVRVNFGAAVDIVGNPVLKLRLATGTEKDMTFDTSKTRTNTTTLDFTYTVAAGDTSAGIGFGANKLSLGTGVTIKATGTDTDAVLTHTAVAASTDHKVDGVLPAFSSATVEGTTLVVTFSESIDSGGTKPASSVFTVTATSGGTSTTVNGSATAVTISGATVTATLASAVAADASATVAYVKPTANQLADLAGNQADGFTGKTVSNELDTAPTFDDGDEVTLMIAENNADGASVGTVAATDADGDSLTYSLASGGDSGSFTIVSTTGEIKVRSGTTLNHESKAEYSITARVTDGEDASGNTETTATIDDTITVTVSVTNVEEPPGAPTSLTVNTIGTTSIAVNWTAPSDTGAKSITDYDLRYFAGSADPTDAADWIEEGETNGHTHTGTATTATIANLTPGTAYRFQVRAESDGEGAWSDSLGATTARPAVFRIGISTSPTYNRTFKTGDVIQAFVDFSDPVDVTGSPVLKMLLATGQERDMAYNRDAGHTNVTRIFFDYSVAAGDVSTAGVAFEANKLSLPSSAAIKATGHSVNALLPHDAVAANGNLKVDGVAPTFSSAVVSGSTLVVTFSESMNETVSAATSSVFTVTATTGGTPTTVNGSGTAVTVSGATVSATLASSVNADATVTVAYVVPTHGPKLLDAAGNTLAAFSGKTVSNESHTVPAFDDGDDVTLMIAENNADEASVGTVAATDADADTLTYSLASGGDSASFTIDSGTGEVKVASGTTFNFETKAEYSFTARVTDGEDSSGSPEGTATIDDTIAVTVEVTNVEEPPGRPDGPAHSGSSPTSLTMTWSAPSSTGAKAITDYDLRYFAGSTDPADAADWIEEGETNGHTHTGTATMATILNLTPGTEYRVQVRAEGDGESPWSLTGSASTTLPMVSSVGLTGSPPSGQSDGYRVDDVVNAQVTFDYDVDVTGSPVLKLLLATGVERDMTFDTSGSVTNTRTLDFTYTVVEGDVSRAGIGFPANALSAGAGVTIRSSGSTKDADLTHSAVPASSSHRVNYTPPPPAPPGGGGSPPPTEPPLAEEPRAAGPEVTLTFERALDPTSVPDPSDFTVTVTEASSSAVSSSSGPETVATAQEGEYRVTAVSIFGATLRLTISPPIPAGASVSVQYTKGANPLRVSDGQPTPTYQDVPDFEEEVTNETRPGGGEPDPAPDPEPEPEPEPTNGLPVADAGTDQDAAPGARVQLDGSGSSDPDG